MSMFITRLYYDALAQKGVFFDGGVLYIYRERDDSDTERKRFARITRQMIYYGFTLVTKKYNKSYIGYTHPNFVEGRPDLLEYVYKRRKDGSTGPRKRGRKKKLCPMYIDLPDDAYDGEEHPFLEPLYCDS
jgi:hypothetical protein